MRKILFISLISLFFASGCSDDDTVYTLDALSIKITGDKEPSSVGDGNWSVTLEPEYAGVFKTEINTSAAWECSITYYESGDKEWVTPSINSGTGTGKIDLTIDNNIYVAYRKALVRFRTLGDIPNDKLFTIIQAESDPLIIIDADDADNVDYDENGQTITLDYNPVLTDVGLWANMTNYVLNVIPEEGSSDDVSWVSCSVNGDALNINAERNYTGQERRARLEFEAGDFKDYYYIVQKQSLYVNEFLSVDGNIEPAILKAGNYGFNQRAIILKFSSNEQLQAEIIDDETGIAAGWVEALVSGNGANITVTLTLAENAGDANKSGTLKVGASNSNYDAQKPIEWKLTQQGQLLVIEWVNLLIDDKLIYGTSGRTNVRFASFSTSDDEGLDLTVTQSEPWLGLSVDGRSIVADIAAYGGAGQRTATVVISNKNGTKNQSVTVVQDQNKVNAKTNWSIEFANNNTTQYSGRERQNMIDGTTNTWWEWNWSGDGAAQSQFPYEFIIDFGSEQVFNSFDLWQELSNLNSPVKDLVFAAGNDRENWIHMGQFVASTSVDECRAHGNNPYSFFSEKTVKARYLKFSILNNTGGAGVNNPKNAKVAELSVYLR